MTRRKAQAISVANRHIIERPRLTRLLDETTARVIMLVAPAGYGKTTLARQWVRERRHCWLHLTVAHTDIAALAAATEAALDTILREEGRSVAKWLSVTSNPSDSLDALAALQNEELTNWPDDAWLVLDEYEWLASSAACEEYVRLILEGSRVQLLLTSRERPDWATARRRVYGDFTLVDRRMLRMNDEESKRVVSHAAGSVPPALVQAASGWPAVLGLAVAGHSMGDMSDVVPETLYEYLADELFLRSSTELQAALPCLALAPDVAPEVAKIVCGSGSSDVLAEAAEAGYFADVLERPSFHPLLKDFLIAKLRPEDSEATRVASQLVDLYTTQQAWDSAFHVLRNWPSALGISRLIAAGHEPLLREGRTATLREWLASSDEAGVHSPRIDLLKAELAAREGRTTQAERTALYVANLGNPEVRFEALCLAGRAAHLNNHEAAALSYFRDAEGLAPSGHARQEARWGALVCASALHDKEELARSLHEFLEYEPRCADDVIRAANARLYASAVLGGLDLALDEALGVVDLSSECDPLVATSFLNALSRLLSLAARYKEGSDIADRAILLAEQAGLRFVRPHGLVARAVARIGLGAYSEANDATEEAAKLANEIHDRHNMVDACVVRARLALCEGEVEHAIRLTEESPRGVTSGLEAEFAATRALALACFGRSVESEEILHGLRHLSFLPDTAGLAMATRAVNAARAKDFASLMIQLRNIRDLGAIDALVIAQRASADLAVAERRIDEPDLRELLSTRASLRTRAETPLDTLTPRQLEVLRLLQLGLTNREIAAKLVIEEATAKVHVRYVLRKLGVRSRTEAAILATRLGREAWEAGAPNPNSAG